MTTPEHRDTVYPSSLTTNPHGGKHNGPHDLVDRTIPARRTRHTLLEPTMQRTRPTPGVDVTRSRITKKLSPDQEGTKWLRKRFGSALVCVRYRRDEVAGRRYTTVELLVDEGPIEPRRTTSADVLVFALKDEVELRRALMEHGGTWLPSRRAWKIPHRIATRLRLQHRIIPQASPPNDNKNGKS